MTDPNKSYWAQMAHLRFLALAGFIALAALVAIDVTSSRSVHAQPPPNTVLGGCYDLENVALDNAFDAWWRFEGDYTDFIGNHDASDFDFEVNTSTGYVVGNDGSSSGSALSDLDGVDDAIDVPDSPDWFFGSNNFTIDAWIYVIDQSGSGGIQAATTNEALVGQVAEVDDPDDENNWTGWSFGIAGLVGNGVLGFGAQDNDEGSTTDVAALSGAVVWTAGWNHVAVTRSGSTYTFYHNGSPVGGGSGLSDSSPIPDVEEGVVGAPLTPPTHTGWPLQIGGLDNSNPALSTNTFFNGRIDELQISNGTALSGGQISGIYNAGVEGKCTAYFTICKEAPFTDGREWGFNVNDVSVTEEVVADFYLEDGECQRYATNGGTFEVEEIQSFPWVLIGVQCVGEINDWSITLPDRIDLDLRAGDDVTCYFLNTVPSVDGNTPDDFPGRFTPTPTPTATPTSTPVPGAHTPTPTPDPGSPNIGGIFGGVIGQAPAGVRNQPTAAVAATTPATISPPNTGDGGLR